MRTWFIAIAMVICAAALRAQLPPAAQPTLLRIPFRFESDSKTPLQLRAEDVRVLEDGKERAISGLEGGDSDTRPIELTLLFDTGMRIAASYVNNPLGKIRLDQLPVAGVAVYGFENLLMPFCAPTKDPRVLSEALKKVRSFINENADHSTRLGLYDDAFGHAAPPPGSTAIAESFFYGATDTKRDGSTAGFAAVRALLKTLSSQPSDVRRGLVVLGRADPGMRIFKPAEISALANELGIPLYPARVIPRLTPDKHERSDKFFDEPFLALGPATGGASFAADLVTAQVLTDILSRVANHLRASYVAKYQPEPTGIATKHRLLIRVRTGVPGSIDGGFREAVY